MCGIAGVVSFSGIGEPERAAAAAMNRALAHRGPDDEGVESFPHCVLAHRRLAIIDLSSDGHQPFVSPDRRYHMLFNGEIFNYIELREELAVQGVVCRTKSDTEVLLNAFIHWGERCLDKLNGMFAFVIYDAVEGAVFLARDRFGIKPLYYTEHEDKFYFASETKALLEVLKLKATLNYQSVFDFLVFGRTDVFDETFLNQIKRTPKGHCGWIRNGKLSLRCWWSPLSFVDKHGDIALSEAVPQIRELLISSVLLRMRSDVPVGSCLSGGLDSSILLGILGSNNLLSSSYATFTACFPGDPLDESGFVDKLQQRWGCANHRTFPTAESALQELRDFTYSADEPTLNGSFYSQYEVMRLARQHGVKVLLDGQGGDENFAGYQYFHGFNLYDLLLRGRLLRLCGELSQNVLRSQHRLGYQTFAFQLLPSGARKRILYRAAPYLNRDFFESHIEKSRVFREFFDVRSVNESIARHFQYKLEHLLRIEDRNSMRFSIEARVPYLDYRLVEFALGLPGTFKVHQGETKYIQKLALRQFTIPEIADRRDKIGFGTPTDKWLATQDWQSIVRSSVNRLADTLPQVFTPAVTEISTGPNAWRLSQLDLWREIFSVSN